MSATSRSDTPAYVLDAYAILCYLQDEPGADRVGTLLREARAGRARLLVTWVNLGEVYYRVCRTRGENKADEVLGAIKGWPLTVLAADEELTLAAARIKAAYPLAYADAYAIAAALTRGATLVTGDPEIRDVKDRLALALCWVGK